MNRPGHKLPHKSMHLSPALPLQKQQALQQQQPPIQVIQQVHKNSKHKRIASKNYKER